MSVGVSPSKPTSSQLEDALIYLPRKGVVEYRRGQIIYDQNQPANGIHLVVQGRVRVCTTLDSGAQTVLGIFCSDEFFGESGLLELPARPDSATAMERTTIMSWTTAEIEEQIRREPRLGFALMQMLVERCLRFEERLQSLALEKTPERVAQSLLHFARQHGKPVEDGALHLSPMTHQVISEFVGTSREIVTFQMNRLRQLGYLRYSRRGIDVYADALEDHLKQRSGAAA